jgi:hypothetical protein
MRDSGRRHPPAGKAEDAFSNAIGEELRAHPTPDLTAAVMRGIRESERDRSRSWSALLAWMWQPVTLQLRPAFAAAFALVLGVGLWAGFASVPAAAPPPAAADDAPAMVLVHFRLEAPGARSVALAGSFSEWSPDFALHESLPGVWTLVVPLQAGVHDYLFVVDGEQWVPDPHAPRVDDGFGAVNSRLALTALSSRS